jgi:hypothetical protein
VSSRGSMYRRYQSEITKCAPLCRTMFCAYFYFQRTCISCCQRKSKRKDIVQFPDIRPRILLAAMLQATSGQEHTLMLLQDADNPGHPTAACDVFWRAITTSNMASLGIMRFLKFNIPSICRRALLPHTFGLPTDGAVLNLALLPIRCTVVVLTAFNSLHPHKYRLRSAKPLEIYQWFLAFVAVTIVIAGR